MSSGRVEIAVAILLAAAMASPAAGGTQAHAADAANQWIQAAAADDNLSHLAAWAVQQRSADDSSTLDRIGSGDSFRGPCPTLYAIDGGWINDEDGYIVTGIEAGIWYDGCEGGGRDDWFFVQGPRGRASAFEVDGRDNPGPCDFRSTDPNSDPMTGTSTHVWANNVPDVTAQCYVNFSQFLWAATGQGFCVAGQACPTAPIPVGLRDLF